MATVTYKNQPGIHKTRGSVPLEGTKHIYRVGKVLWYKEIETVLQDLCVGKTLHVCSGHSQLGDVRVDMDEDVSPNVIGDAARLPFRDSSFVTVLCDPPYNGKFQWNHDMLNELARVAAGRIIFQHWFIPANGDGLYKKAHKFSLVQLLCWQPRTYFGRVQMVSVFDVGASDNV